MAHAPEPGFAVVVSDEEAGAGQPGVIISLAVIRRPDRHVVRLALDDDQRVLAVCLVLRRAPDDEVGPGVTGAAAGHVHLLGDLSRVGNRTR